MINIFIRSVNYTEHALGVEDLGYPPQPLHHLYCILLSGTTTERAHLPRAQQNCCVLYANPKRSLLRDPVMPYLCALPGSVSAEEITSDKSLCDN